MAPPEALGRVVRIRPSAGARKRAGRDADALAVEAIEALVAFRGGDGEAAHRANWAVARLMILAYRHGLDLPAEWVS